MTGLPTVRLDYLERIWKLRYFWFSLVQNDLANRYKGSFLGMGWSLLRPMVMTTVFCVVFGKLFNLSLADYAPYLLLGMTTWQFLTESINSGCTSFVSGSAYIKQQRVPLAIFPLRMVLGCAFHFLIALVMALAITLAFRGYLDPIGILALLPALVLVFLLAWSFAIVAGVLQAHFPDMANLLELALQIAFYGTPIIYRLEDMQKRGRLATFIEWNPFTSLLALIRTPILEGTAPSGQHILISVLFLAAIGTLAVVLLRKLERTLVFWI